MTREQEIAARGEAATPGPWRDGELEQEAIVGAPPPGYVGVGGIPVLRPTNHGSLPRPADRDLITHAPADLAYLLQRVADLERATVEAGARGYARGVEEERAAALGWLRAALAAYRGDKVTPAFVVIADLIRDIKQGEHHTPTKDTP